jgi:glutathione S-transferase
MDQMSPALPPGILFDLNLPTRALIPSELSEANPTRMPAFILLRIRQWPKIQHLLSASGQVIQTITNGSVVALIRVEAKPTMTLRIEKDSDGRTTTIRLIGQIQAEHLEALKEQMKGSGHRTVLDLDEVTLVDVNVVRFLGVCEAQGIGVLNGSPYIREWMRREQDRER